jgi:hypothetical protein
MVRIFAGVAVAAMLAGCASAPTPKTPAEMILGSWTCKTETDGVTVSGVTTYVAGGTATASVKVTVNQPGMAVDINATADSVWSFLADGKMQETVTKATVLNANMGGQDLPAAMIQPMMDEMVVNQTATSTAIVTPSALTITDEEGTTTNCTR